MIGDFVECQRHHYKHAPTSECYGCLVDERDRLRSENNFSSVGIVKKLTGDLNDMTIIEWSGPQPSIGSVLYVVK